MTSRTILSGAVAIATLAATSALAQDAIKFTVPVINTSFAHVFVAADRGYFKENGLDVELVRAGGSVATSALISGGVQFSGSPSSAFSAIVKGADIRVILINSSDPQFTLWSFDPEVTTIEALRGKSVATVTRGDTMEIAMSMFLKARGLPKDYVGYTALGDEGGRFAAISSGAQKYALLLRSDVPRLEALGVLKGGKILADFGKEFEMPTGGVAVAGKELDANPERVKKMLRALRQGVAYTRAFKDETIAFMQKRLPNTPREAIQRDLEAAISTQTKDGTVSMETAARELAVRGELLGAAPDKIPPVEKVFDFAPVRAVNAALAAEGWKPVR